MMLGVVGGRGGNSGVVVVVGVHLCYDCSMYGMVLDLYIGSGQDD